MCYLIDMTRRADRNRNRNRNRAALTADTLPSEARGGLDMRLGVFTRIRRTGEWGVTFLADFPACPVRRRDGSVAWVMLRDAVYTANGVSLYEITEVKAGQVAFALIAQLQASADEGEPRDHRDDETAALASRAIEAIDEPILARDAATALRRLTCETVELDFAAAREAFAEASGVRAGLERAVDAVPARRPTLRIVRPTPIRRTDPFAVGADDDIML